MFCWWIPRNSKAFSSEFQKHLDELFVLVWSHDLVSEHMGTLIIYVPVKLKDSAQVANIEKNGHTPMNILTLTIWVAMHCSSVEDTFGYIYCYSYVM